MSWADALYEPENEPGLAPVRQEGGHIISAILDNLGLGPWRRGEWSGQATGTQSPMYGRKWGEAPIADILGNIDLPAKGAMAALPAAAGIVLDAGKQVKSLAKGIPYRDILAKFLDDPNVVVPYLPKSYAEPVVAKSTGKNIAPIAEAMGLPEYGKAKGFRNSLPEGSMLASTIERQERTMPHEFGHEVQRNWSREPVFGEALNKETLDLFSDLNPELRDQYFARWGKWPTYNNTSKFANELAADFVNPETFAQRFPDTISALTTKKQGLFVDLPAMNENYGWGHLKEELANRYPTVGAFWDEVPGRIPENVYDLP